MFCVYSPSQNIAMLWTGKCACTETRQLWYHLHRADMIRSEPTNQWHAIGNDFPSKPNPQRAFYVSRHPYLRAISGYCHFFRQVCKVNSAQRQPILASFRKHMGSGAKHSFRNFVQYLARATKVKEHNLNIHFKAQTASVLPVQWNKVTIIHLENGKLEEEITAFYRHATGTNEFTDKIHEFYQTPHPKNITAKRKFDETNQEIVNMEPIDVYPLPEQFIVPELVAIIEQVFAKDYKTLGYQLGINMIK
jgi:hypothetical protein